MSLINLPEDIIFKILTGNCKILRRIQGFTYLHMVCKKLYHMITKKVSTRMSVICDYSHSKLFCDHRYNDVYTHAPRNTCRQIHPKNIGQMCYTRIFDFSYSNITNNHLQYLRYPEKVNLAGTKIDDYGIDHLKTVKYLNIENCENVIGYSFKKLTDLEVIIIFNNSRLGKEYYNSLFLRGIKVWNYDQEW